MANYGRPSAGAEHEMRPLVASYEQGRGLIGRRAQTVVLSLLASLLILTHYSAFVEGVIFPRVFYGEVLNLGEQLLALGLALVPSLWMPNRLTKVSDPIVLTLYLIGYLPIALLVPRLAHDGAPGFQVVAVILLGLGLLEVMRNLPAIRTRIALRNHQLFRRGLIVASLVSTAVTLLAYGLPTQLIGLDYVYVAREVFNNFASDEMIRAIANYLIQWNVIIFLPYICVTSENKKSLITSVIYLFFTAFLYFNITSYQIVLVIPLVLVGFFFLYKFVKRHGLNVIVMGFCALMVVGGILSFVFRNTEYELIASMPVYRFVHIPGLLGSLYLDAFSTDVVARSTAGVHPGYIVGSLYFGDSTMLATTSFWFIAFAEYQYAGIIAVSILLGMYLWLIDCVVDPSFDVLLFSLSGVIAYFLVGAGLGTAMMTYGLLPLLILCAIAPRIRKRRPG